MCPELCEAEDCERELNKPYKLPCGHYIGEHCKEKMQRIMDQGDAGTCPVVNCAHQLEGETQLEVDKVALKNKYEINK